MTVSAQTTINGQTIGFNTDEPDKAFEGLELLERLEKACDTIEEVLDGLKDLSDNYQYSEEDEDYVETEDDEELCDLAYEEGYDAGFSGECCFADNPYDRGTVANDSWAIGYREGINDYEWDNS